MNSGVSARIFDIQRFCLHDGQGIRTAVFFKGCPLRCVWCHNPESLSGKTQLFYRAHKCAGCGACAYACPNGVHRFEGGKHRVDFGRCVCCGKCADVCCYGALELSGKTRSLEEVLASLMIDRPYFEKGGGVTLSGGEPLAQPEFSAALAQSLKELGIHVALETSGYAPADTFESVVKNVDLVLFDCKASDEEHERLTGVSNRSIKENLEILNEMGKDTILRCPLIPGLNDDAAHLKDIAEMKKRYKSVKSVELLPYHRMGETKRVQLGWEESLPDIGLPDESDKRRWLDVLAGLGCEAKLT